MNLKVEDSTVGEGNCLRGALETPRLLLSDVRAVTRRFVFNFQFLFSPDKMRLGLVAVLLMHGRMVEFYPVSAAVASIVS